MRETRFSSLKFEILESIDTEVAQIGNNFVTYIEFLIERYKRVAICLRRSDTRSKRFQCAFIIEVQNVTLGEGREKGSETYRMKSGIERSSAAFILHPISLSASDRSLLDT